MKHEIGSDRERKAEPQREKQIYENGEKKTSGKTSKWKSEIEMLYSY